MTADERSDENLMAAVRRGDRTGLTLLFERHSRRLFGFLRGLTGSSTAAEDLVQETFLRVLRHRRSYRAGRAFLPWMLGIARNAAWAHLRKASRMPPAELPELVDTASPERRRLERERSERLWRALQELPARDREILLLSYFDGLGYRQIAEVTGVGAGAAKVRAHRARKALRRRLDEEETLE